MPFSSKTLFRDYLSKSNDLTVRAIPDYTVLFWHRVHDWEYVNGGTHGHDPSNTAVTSGKYFRQYELGLSATPDVASFYTPANKPSTKYNYIVRCLSSDTDWPLLCDLRFAANTNMPNTQATLLDINGNHGITLPGRTAPPLPADGTAASAVALTLYNSSHTGHFHQVEGLYNLVNTIDGGNTVHELNGSASSRQGAFKYEYYSAGIADDSWVPNSMASFFVDPIIKDPKLDTVPITTIPQDCIVLYYGNDGLPSPYYDPHDVTVSDTTNNMNDVSANGYILPITFARSTRLLDTKNVGVKNLFVVNVVPSSTVTGTTISSIPSANIVSINAGNTITFTLSSNSSGYHDHKTLGGSTKTVTTATAVSYSVVPPALAGAALTTINTWDTADNESILHRHKVTYKAEVKLKSKKLKGYRTTSPNAPIEDGLILGYSIGKYSKYTGNSTDGANILPKGWYFCDGNNGTPDLRGRYPFLNFKDSNQDSENDTGSSLSIKSINVQTVDWKHSHVYPATTTAVTGAAGSKDVGNHGSNYDVASNPSNTTKHSHVVSSVNTFQQVMPNGSLSTKGNAKVGSQIDYEPPTVEIAFIMFKSS
jgi:hypothetical protein